jgi:hypothetical protein
MESEHRFLGGITFLERQEGLGTGKRERERESEREQ